MYYLELPALNATQPLSKLRKEIITFLNPCAEFRNILIDNGACIQPQSSDNKDQHSQYSSLSLTNLLTSTTSSTNTSIHSSISPNDSYKSAKKKNSLNSSLAIGVGVSNNSSKNSFNEQTSKLNNSINSSHSISPSERTEKAVVKKVKIYLLVYTEHSN
jgi:hypothetical protein